MRHHQEFLLKAEGYVTHRDDTLIDPVCGVEGLDWRACLRVGGTFHWKWFKTETEALAWIESWKKELDV